MCINVLARWIAGSLVYISGSAGCGAGTSTSCVGLFIPRSVHPAVPSKTKTSRAALPIPQSLVFVLSAHVGGWSEGGHVFVNEWGDQLAPRTLQRAIRNAREKVPGLAPGFRCHDLRHYLASLLIASGAAVKVVQDRLWHASAKTTLDTYAHLWPDSDERTRHRHRRGHAGAGRGITRTRAAE
ncbi:MAG: tyrosine-type recombinase/integrase [Marmoricola sp.]